MPTDVTKAANLLKLEGPRERVYGAALFAAKASGWKVTEESGRSGVFRALTSKFFFLRREVRVEVRPGGPRAWEIQVDGLTEKLARRFFERVESEYPGARR